MTEKPADDERLRELVETIRREHELLVEAAGQMVLHAVAIGEALIEAQRIVPPGEWVQWVETNMPHARHRATCGNYMRLAALKEHIDPDLTLTANLRLVTGLERRAISTPRVPAEAREEALRLLATGVYSRAKVARLTGVGKDTLRGWVEPEYAKRRAAMSNASARRRRVQQRGTQLAAVPALNERYKGSAIPHGRAASSTDFSMGVSAFRYGEPGRAAVGRAVRALAQTQGQTATARALRDLAAICVAWAERLEAPLTNAERDAV